MKEMKEKKRKEKTIPSPLVQLAAWMNHLCWLCFAIPSLSAISETDIAWGKSCLFARINTFAFRSWSSCNILSNSIAASSILSRSFESTTKMSPSVFSYCFKKEKKEKRWEQMNENHQIVRNVSRVAWWCPVRQCPTRWSECCGNQQFQHWILQKKRRKKKEQSEIMKKKSDWNDV